MVAVLRLGVGIVQHTEPLCHLIGVVLQVTPFQTCLEHHLDALAAWRDEHPQDAQFLEVIPLEPLASEFLGIRHMVGIQHCQSRQVTIGLYAPQPCAPPSVLAFGKVCHRRDGGRQGALLLRDVEFHTFQVVGRHEFPFPSLILLQFLREPLLVVLGFHNFLHPFLHRSTYLSLCHLVLQSAVSVDEFLIPGLFHQALEHLCREFLGGFVNVGLINSIHHLYPPFLMLFTTLLNFSLAGSLLTTS